MESIGELHTLSCANMNQTVPAEKKGEGQQFEKNIPVFGIYAMMRHWFLVLCCGQFVKANHARMQVRFFVLICVGQYAVVSQVNTVARLSFQKAKR